MSKSWVRKTVEAIRQKPEVMVQLADEGQRYLNILGGRIPKEWRVVRRSGAVAWRRGDVLVRATLSEADAEGWATIAVSVSIQRGEVPFRAPNALVREVRDVFIGRDAPEIPVHPTTEGSPIMFMECGVQIRRPWRAPMLTLPPVPIDPPPRGQASDVVNHTRLVAPAGWNVDTFEGVPIYRHPERDMMATLGDFIEDTGEACRVVRVFSEKPFDGVHEFARAFLGPDAYAAMGLTLTTKDKLHVATFTCCLTDLDWLHRLMERDEPLMLLEAPKSAVVVEGRGKDRVEVEDPDLSRAMRSVLVPEGRCWRCDLGYHEPNTGHRNAA